MNIDFNKRGIIVLSTYRSGGTQLTRFLNTLCVQHFDEPDEKWAARGEVEVGIEGDVLKDTLESLYNDNNKFEVWLLNNPLSILSLYANNEFTRLSNEYNIIHLSRLNKANGVLSLGLWEKLIEKGYFKIETSEKYKGYSKEAMNKFHNEVLKDKLGYIDVSVGHSALDESKSTLKTTNTKLMMWSYEDNLNKCIAKLHSLPCLFYEEYEHDYKTFMSNHFPWASQYSLDEIAGSYRHKIPYIYKDYRKYYQDDIVKLLKQWGIANL